MDTQNKDKPSRAEKLTSRFAGIGLRARSKWFSGIKKEDAARALLFFAAAFLLSRAQWMFGTYPFGPALLCAAGTGLWAVYCGCVAGAFFTSGTSPLLFVAVYSLILVVRLRAFQTDKTAAREERGARQGGSALRTALAAVASFAPGVYGCVTERFTLHSLFALLFYLAAGSVFAFLFDGLRQGVAVRRLQKKAAYAALLFALVFSFTTIRFFSVSPAPAVAAFLCLLCASNEDFLSSGALGLILGVACGRDYALIIGATGLITSAFYKYSKRLAPWLGVLSGFAVAFYSKGASSFVYVLPDLVAGLLICLPVQAFLTKRKARSAAEARSVGRKYDQTPVDLPQRLQTLGEKISVLSQKLRAPCRDRVTTLCENTLKASCAHCGNDCFADRDALSRAANALFETGAAAPDRPPFAGLTHCRRKQALCDDLNNAYADLRRRREETDRAECYASCFKGVAQLLYDREAAEKEDQQQNEADRAALRDAAQGLSFAFRDVFVTGVRRQKYRITGVDEEEISVHVPQIKSLLEEQCAKKLSCPVLSSTGSSCALTFYTLPVVRGVSGCAVMPKEGEKDCGDTVCTFTANNCFYALICDGMGSGREAALISRICCRFIEDLTEMGASMKTVLSTLNDFLIAQNIETTSTVDFLRIDLFNGSCDFVKCGACPSLVLRQNNTFKIASASIPVGGAHEANFEQITVRLRAGDRVIMVSDGVSEEIEGAAWLSDLLAGRLRNDPQGLANDILRISAEKQNTPDDKSVIVVDLLPAEE